MLTDNSGSVPPRRLGACFRVSDMLKQTHSRLRVLGGPLVSLVRMLVDLSPTQLTRLAERWGVASLPTDGLVTRLYHEMTEEASVGRALDQLDEAGRAILDRLIDSRDAVTTGAALLRSLPFTGETLEARLRDLRDRGLIGVELLDGPRLSGVQRPRPNSSTTLPGRASVAVGSGSPTDAGAWSLRWSSWVPGDLATVIRRARANQIASLPETLRRILGSLDLPALQRLAITWGIVNAEHVYKRELIRALEARLGKRESVAEALAWAGEPASRVFQAVIAQGGQAAIGEVVSVTGLGEVAIRRAVHELVSRCLLRETRREHDSPKDTTHAATPSETLLIVPVGVARIEVE